jgi:hypothetical protein
MKIVNYYNHADGAASSQVFLYPASLDMRWAMKQIGLKRESWTYIIRNSRIEPDWETVKPRILCIPEN